MIMCCNFLTINTETLSYIETIELEIKYIFTNNIYCTGLQQCEDTPLVSI
jgi:hypothetical protein